MKYSIQKRYIFFFICIYLIQISKGNEQKQLERFKNSIYLALSRINGIIDNLSLTFEYDKYNITLNNFLLLKPFGKNITINKEIKNKNETFLNIGGIMTTVKAEVTIDIFLQKERQIKSQPIFFEIYFDEIKYKLINNFNVEYTSLNISSLIYKNINKLDYFSDFNNKKICFFYETGKEVTILEDVDSKLKEIFLHILEKKIKEKEKNYNVLTYDMIHLIDTYPYVFKTNTFNYIFGLSLKKIELSESDINLNLEENNITINYFILKGTYVFSGYSEEDYFDFNVSCIKNKEYFKYKYKEKKAEIKLNIKDCKISDNNYDFQTYDFEYNEEIRKILQEFYIDYLQNLANKYYNETFNEI